MSSNKLILKDYSPIIKDLIDKFKSTKNILNNSSKLKKDSLNLRKYLILETLSFCKIFKQSDDTFINTIYIFDYIFQFYSFDLTLKDMYIIIMTSLFISSKIEDSNHLQVLDIISFNSQKWSIIKEDILGAERIILEN